MNVTCRFCNVTFSTNHYDCCPLCAHKRALASAMDAIRRYDGRKALRRCEWILDGLRMEIKE